MFFLFGWLLFRGRRELERLRMWWSWRLPVLVVPVVAACYLAMRTFSGDSRIVHAAGCVLIGFSTWALVLASFGAFLTHATRERTAVRYLSDGSYWMYIVHLPVVLFVAGLLAPAALPAIVKFAIVLTAATAVSVATYHAFVRRTIVGRWLNGRRVAAPPVVRGQRPAPTR